VSGEPFVETDAAEARLARRRQHNRPHGFSDIVDWSAILIDLWSHLGSCPSWVDAVEKVGVFDLATVETTYST
jgi:hypothetical protein